MRTCTIKREIYSLVSECRKTCPNWFSGSTSGGLSSGGYPRQADEVDASCITGHGSQFALSNVALGQSCRLAGSAKDRTQVYLCPTTGAFKFLVVHVPYKIITRALQAPNIPSYPPLPSILSFLRSPWLTVWQARTGLWNVHIVELSATAFSLFPK